MLKKVCISKKERRERSEKVFKLFDQSIVLVLYLFVDICSWSGISVRKEVDIGLYGDRDRSLRPADILLYS